MVGDRIIVPSHREPGTFVKIKVPPEKRDKEREREEPNRISDLLQLRREVS
jgi:hypothetical protein